MNAYSRFQNANETFSTNSIKVPSSPYDFMTLYRYMNFGEREVISTSESSVPSIVYASAPNYQAIEIDNNNFSLMASAALSASASNDAATPQFSVTLEAPKLSGETYDAFSNNGFTNYWGPLWDIDIDVAVSEYPGMTLLEILESLSIDPYDIDSPINWFNDTLNPAVLDGRGTGVPLNLTGAEGDVAEEFYANDSPDIDYVGGATIHAGGGDDFIYSDGDGGAWITTGSGANTVQAFYDGNNWHQVSYNEHDNWLEDGTYTPGGITLNIFDDYVADVTSHSAGVVSDTLTGVNAYRLTAGDDVVVHTGDDRIVINPGEGNDVITGSVTGRTQVRYDADDEHYGATGGILANLSSVSTVVAGRSVAANTVIDGFGDSDTLHDVDQIRGSNFVDHIIGSDGEDNVNGNSGDDFFEMGDGDDFVNPGSGNNTINMGTGWDEVGYWIELDDGESVDDLDVVINDDFLEILLNDIFIGSLGFSASGDLVAEKSYGNDVGTTDTITGAEEVWIEFADENGREVAYRVEVDSAGETLDVEYREDIRIYGTDDDDDIIVRDWLIANGYDPENPDYNIRIETYDGDDYIDGRDVHSRLRIEAGDGNDTIYGGEQNDHISAGAGTDTIYADVDNYKGYGDFVEPGTAGPSGSDFVHGSEELFLMGDGTDLSFGDENGVGGLTIFLDQDGSGRVVSGDATIDTSFTNVHYFTGSGDGDTFDMSDSDHGTGLIGLSGHDTFIGGEGWDRVRYDDAYWYDGFDGVIVNLSDIEQEGVASGTARDPFGYTDTLIDIDSVTGTRFADKLYGSSGRDNLEGREGDDFFFTENGDDWISPGAGSDEVHGGLGIDGVWYWNEDGSRSEISVDFSFDDTQAFISKNNNYFGKLQINADDTVSVFGLTDNADTDILTEVERLDLNFEDGRFEFYFDLDNGVISLLERANVNIEGTSGSDIIFVDEEILALDLDPRDPDLNVNVDSYAGNDVIDGTGVASRMHIDAGDGDDTIHGGAENDHLSGGSGNDIIYANHFKSWGDWVEPGTGSDFVYGNEAKWNAGRGTDLGYTNVNEAIAVTVFSDGTGSVVADTFTDYIEYADYFHGTAFSDMFDVSASDHHFTFNGFAGDDTFIGGTGWTSVQYRNENGADGIIVNLSDSSILTPGDYANPNVLVAPGKVRDTYGDTDTLTNIKSVRGSNNDDYIVGSRFEDSLQGGAGNDYIEAGAGDDWINTGTGDDTVDGGDGFDTLSYWVDLDDDNRGPLDHFEVSSTRIGIMDENGVEFGYIEFDAVEENTFNIVNPGGLVDDVIVDVERITLEVRDFDGRVDRTDILVNHTDNTFEIDEDETVIIEGGAGRDVIILEERLYDLGLSPWDPNLEIEIYDGLGDDFIDISGVNGDIRIYDEGGNDTYVGDRENVSVYDVKGENLFDLGDSMRFRGSVDNRDKDPNSVDFNKEMGVWSAATTSSPLIAQVGDWTASFAVSQYGDLVYVEEEAGVVVSTSTFESYSDYRPVRFDFGEGELEIAVDDDTQELAYNFSIRGQTSTIETELGNVDDYVFDGIGDEEIYTHGGNDYVELWNGGDDEVWLGDGDDVIWPEGWHFQWNDDADYPTDIIHGEGGYDTVHIDTWGGIPPSGQFLVDEVAPTIFRVFDPTDPEQDFQLYLDPVGVSKVYYNYFDPDNSNPFLQLDGIEVIEFNDRWQTVDSGRSERWAKFELNADDGTVVVTRAGDASDDEIIVDPGVTYFNLYDELVALYGSIEGAPREIYLTGNHDVSTTYDLSGVGDLRVYVEDGDSDDTYFADGARVEIENYDGSNTFDLGHNGYFYLEADNLNELSFNKGQGITHHISSTNRLTANGSDEYGDFTADFYFAADGSLKLYDVEDGETQTITSLRSWRNFEVEGFNELADIDFTAEFNFNNQSVVYSLGRSDQVNIIDTKFADDSENFVFDTRYDDEIFTYDGNDHVQMWDGGSDYAALGAGDDSIIVDAWAFQHGNYDAAQHDFVDGGTGYDILHLDTWGGTPLSGRFDVVEHGSYVVETGLTEFYFHVFDREDMKQDFNLVLRTDGTGEAYYNHYDAANENPFIAFENIERVEFNDEWETIISGASDRWAGFNLHEDGVTFETSGGIVQPEDGSFEVLELSRDGMDVEYGIFATDAIPTYLSGIRSFDFELNYSGSDFELYDAGFEFADGLTVVTNTGIGGNVQIAGYSNDLVNGFTNVESPLVTFSGQILPGTNDLEFSISEVIVDDMPGMDTTVLFSFEDVDVNISTVSRGYKVIKGASVASLERPGENGIYIKPVSFDDDGIETYGVYAQAGSDVSSFGFTLDDLDGGNISNFVIEERFDEIWTTAINQGADIISVSSLSLADSITADEPTLLATFEYSADINVELYDVNLGEKDFANLIVNEQIVYDTDGDVTHTLSNDASAVFYASKDFINEAPTRAINSQDALEALRIAVGFNDNVSDDMLIAADFNQDGRVNSADALEILKFSVGLSDLEAFWVFVDEMGLEGTLTYSNVDYSPGIEIESIRDDLQVELVGILLGDVNDTYTNLIA